MYLRCLMQWWTVSTVDFVWRDRYACGVSSKSYRSIFISTAETIKTNAVTILCSEDTDTHRHTHTQDEIEQT